MLKFFTASKVYDVGKVSIIWVKNERVVNKNQYVEQAAKLIVGMEHNYFETTRTLLAITVSFENMELSEAYKKRKHPINIGLMVHRGRTLAHEHICAKFVPAFLSSFPKDSPLHPFSGTREKEAKLEAKSLLEHGFFKKDDVYHPVIHHACFARKMKDR